MSVPRLTARSNVRAELECLPNQISSIRLSAPTHCHDYFEFFLIVSGKCRHLVNGGEQRLSEGALVFIRPDDTHSYDYDGGGDCEFINITCTARVIREAFAYLGGDPLRERFLTPRMPPVAQLSQLEKENYLAQFERLKALGTLEPGAARLLLRSLVVESFSRYFLTHHFTVGKDVPPWFDILLTRMQKKENFTAGLRRLYELTPISAGHIHRTFRQFLGTTPTAYINRLRLDYAKSLLLTTDRDIAEISLEAGFENLSHFYHLFRREYSAAPAQLRQTRASA